MYSTTTVSHDHMQETEVSIQVTCISHHMYCLMVTCGDTTGISLGCGLLHFTISLRFSSTYAFPSFWCFHTECIKLGGIPVGSYTLCDEVCDSFRLCLPEGSE